MIVETKAIVNFVIQNTLKLFWGKEWGKYLLFGVYAIHEVQKYRNFSILPANAKFSNNISV